MTGSRETRVVSLDEMESIWLRHGRTAEEIKCFSDAIKANESEHIVLGPGNPWRIKRRENERYHLERETVLP